MESNHSHHTVFSHCFIRQYFLVQMAKITGSTETSGNSAVSGCTRCGGGSQFAMGNKTQKTDDKNGPFS
jgi:hypothetical protein